METGEHDGTVRTESKLVAAPCWEAIRLQWPNRIPRPLRSREMSKGRRVHDRFPSHKSRYAIQVSAGFNRTWGGLQVSPRGGVTSFEIRVCGIKLTIMTYKDLSTIEQR
jgi:hypothetical protein